MPQVYRTVVFGCLSFAVSGLALLPPIARSDDAVVVAEPSPLDGAWQQVEQKNGDAQEYQKLPEGLSMTIYVTGGRFVWTVVKEGKVIAAAGGRYTVDKDKWTESIEYISGQGVPENFVGSSFDFTWKLDGDTWHKVGTIQVNGQDYKIDEKWERCK